jgi:hypothetical protein
MSKYIEIEDLRKPILFGQIKEILSRINIPIDEIPSEVLKEISQKERPYMNKHLESFILATIDDKFELCKCIFKTLSFENDKLEYKLNKPFDKFFI